MHENRYGSVPPWVVRHKFYLCRNSEKKLADFYALGSLQYQWYEHDSPKCTERIYGVNLPGARPTKHISIEFEI